MSHLSRRSFLTAGIGALASSRLLAQGKPEPAHQGAVIGHGAFRYRVDKLWCKADPAVHPVKDCHEMCQSADGRLFLITNHPKHDVLVFDTEGNVLAAWSLDLKSGHGLTLAKGADDAEHAYLTSNSGRIIKCTLDGKPVLELPDPRKCGAYGANDPYSPTEVAVDAAGGIHVADGYGSQFILRFDRAGKYLGKFGGKSTQPTNPGKFMQAHGVAIDDRGPEPLLVCTERVRNEFNWFTLDGRHVRGVYLPGAYVSRPVISGRHLYSGVCFGARPDDHRMWQGRGFVTILDDRDRVVSNPGGGEPKYEDGRLKPMLQDLPVFNNCHDVCVLTDGDLIVCQWNSGSTYPIRLRKLS